MAVPHQPAPWRNDEQGRFALVCVFLVFAIIGPWVGSVSIGLASSFGRSSDGPILFRNVIAFLQVTILIWPYAFLVGGTAAIGTAIVGLRWLKRTGSLPLIPLVITAFVFWILANVVLAILTFPQISLQMSGADNFLAAHIAATLVCWLISRVLLIFLLTPDEES